MAISKQRLYQKFADAPKAYKIIHFETSSDIVMRSDLKTTVEGSLQTIENRFDENGVLKEEYGGAAAKLEESHTFITNLGSTQAGTFDGTADVSLGVTGILPVTHGGLGTNSLKDALNKFITQCDALDKNGLATNDYVGIADTSGGVGKKVTIDQLAQFISTLITTKPFVISATAPANKGIIWIDSGNSNIAKIHNGSSWIAIKTAWA